ncbi:MAG: hypothetical protein C3L25_13630 [Candidatus Sedimenticola endophacoides]|nr:MAG: hypothetical protein C3L26_13715 [Candidatus Sedimenticola endophacoides]PUD98095.1 MAG: hypothetical protein C3L26_13725 [Candidatus Sedimenticola endophacoides]PUE00545.1 MAG: hypothetical protein C3L25_13620 [Candidatus Sedimenticola endophacoides]PUE00546.1 MAG: hypothetical protein C3L25_13630 [Candidatus Sedimenticola endophacoides]
MARAIPNLWNLNWYFTKSGLNRPFRQIAIANNGLLTIHLVLGVLPQQFGQFRLNSLGKQLPGPFLQ